MATATFNTGLSILRTLFEPADGYYLQSKNFVVASRSIVGLVRGSARPQ